jgi:PmbA protein
MEKLLKSAAAMADQADVYYTEESSDNIQFNDGKLDKADSSLKSGMALRVIKDGKSGFSHTRNLLAPDEMVKQALISAQNGSEARYTLPGTVMPTETIIYDPAIEKLDKKELIDKGKALLDYVKARSDGQINLVIWYSTGRTDLINTNGARLCRKGTNFGAFAQMIFPGTGSGLHTYVDSHRQCWISNAELDRMIELYDICRTELVPPTAKLPVIFHAQSMFTLMWRLNEALSPANIYNGISPLCGREGEKVFSEKLTYWQDPQARDLASSTAFDDEGTPTQTLHFFKDGVFNAYPADLYYAGKLGKEPTGNGFRGSIEAMPGTHIFNEIVDPGTKTLQEMIASIDNGLIVFSLMGAHSGNILAGEFSVGVASGLLIQNGKPVGRVKDCMLSGNVYDNLQRIVDIESTTTPMGGRKYPSVLLDGVSVAGK